MRTAESKTNCLSISGGQIPHTAKTEFRCKENPEKKKNNIIDMPAKRRKQVNEQQSDTPRIRAL